MEPSSPRVLLIGGRSGVGKTSVGYEEMVVRAVGGAAAVTSILLTVEDATARSRIRQREIGSCLDAHLTRSHDVARRRESKAGSSVHRVATDDRSLADIAAVVIRLWHASQD